MSYKPRWISVAAGAMAITAGEAHAQQAGTPATSAPASASPDAPAEPTSSISDIVVTAQRRSENLQRAAASVSVRNGTDLLASGKFALGAILEDVPGVTGGAATSPGGAAGSSASTDSPAAGLTIRGIPSNVGVGGSTVSVSTAAAIYVDGIYNGTGGTYDIDRVEVLRGPQGTLYGRSATSGVVAIRTRNPDLNEVDGNVALERGNYDLQHYTGALNMPIVEGKIALRVAGNYFYRDGYDTHGRGGSTRNKDYRAKLLLQPTDTFSVLLGFTGQDNRVYNSGVNYNVVTPTTLRKEFGPIGEGKNSYRQYWAELNLDLGPIALTYQPAYRTWESRADYFFRRPAILSASDQVLSTPKDTFLTQELRLASHSGGDFTWQAGALYYRNVLDNTSIAREGVSHALQFDSVTAKKTTAIGGFGEATYAFAEGWRVNGGLRYDYTKVELTQTYTTNLNLRGAFGGGPLGSTTYGLPEVLASQTLTGAAGTRVFRNVTYRFRLEHDLTPQNLIYALTSTGFSPGDLSVTTGSDLRPVSVLFDAETLTAYEFGTKNRFFGNRLQVNGAAFYYVYGAFQVANVNISPIAGTGFFSTLSSPARAYGGELEILFQPTRNDRIGLNTGYTHAYFVDADKQIAQGTGGRSFAFFFSNSGIPRVVPFVSQLNYDHDFNFPNNARLTVHGDVRYLSSSMTASVTQTQRALGANAFVRTGAQVIGDITVTLSSPDRRFSLSAYLRNVGDNRYKTAGSIDPGVPFGSSTQLTDPRTYGVVLAAKF